MENTQNKETWQPTSPCLKGVAQTKISQTEIEKTPKAELNLWQYKPSERTAPNGKPRPSFKGKFTAKEDITLKAGESLLISLFDN